MDKADQAPSWAKDTFLFLLNLLPDPWQWFIWRLVRPTYLTGVYVVLLRKNDRGIKEVLLVKKRKGVSSSLGFGLPSGGLTPGIGIPESARQELAQETGITEVELTGLYPSINHNNHDVHYVFGAQMQSGSKQNPRPQDRYEIEFASWTPLFLAKRLLKPQQWHMIEMVLNDRLE